MKGSEDTEGEGVSGGAAEEAARWFVRLQSDDATGDDWLAFEAWLSASPEHQNAYDRVEQLWVEVEAADPRLLEPAPALPPATPARRARGGERRPRMSRRAFAFAGAAAAASIAVAVVGVNPWSGAATQSYVAPLGQTRQVELADGTHIRLNAGSRIDVRLERRARRVTMSDGEAVFDVAHDAARPFVIDTGPREVRVLGTEFNLRQRADAFDLAVRRGLVEVRLADDAGAVTKVPAGHRLRAANGSAGVLSETAPDAAFAWTTGQLIYDNAPLTVVAADLSRSLGVPVRVADAEAGRLRFSGVLTIDDKTLVIRRLEAFAGVRAERVGDGVILHRR